jgi:hypothetical protein
LPTISGAFFNNEVQIGDGTTDTPNIAFLPQTGTEWDLYVTDSDDDFNIKSNTASTENINIINLGAGVANVTIDGTVNVGSPITTGNGGTGLISSGTSGNYLRSNGAIWASSAIQSGDIPAGSTNYIQNTTTAQTANLSVSNTGTSNPVARLTQSTTTGTILRIDDDDNGSGESAHEAIAVRTQGTQRFIVSTNGDGIFTGNLNVGGSTGITWTGTSNNSAILLEQGATPAPTAEGRLIWDTDDDAIVIGNGTSTTTFRSTDWAFSSQEFSFINTSNVQQVVFTGVGNKLITIKVGYTESVVFSSGSPATIKLGRGTGGTLTDNYFATISINTNKTVWTGESFGTTNSDLNNNDIFVITFTGSAGFSSGKCIITTRWRQL